MKLKRCPFCGSSELREIGLPFSRRAVQCAECLALGPEHDELERSGSASIVWNRRYSSERQRIGHAARRLKGLPLGRPVRIPDQTAAEVQKLRSEKVPWLEIARRLKIPHGTARQLAQRKLE